MTRRAVCGAAVVLLALFACLYRLGAPTLEMWDEARLANSALEMLGNGRWLTPHFDGVPDHWSTKPPLMIWMMAGAFEIFGVSDWAARLPAALCGVLLIVGIHAWVTSVTGAPMTGVVASLSLACTPGFLLEHGARAAEYDVPLALAMVGAVYATHRWTGPDRRPPWAPALLALCILAGTMIKTIQAWVILPPLMLWWATRPSRPSLLRAGVLGPALLALLTVAAYVWARQLDDPQYLAATWYNDIAGRFTEPQEGHEGQPFWYLLRVKNFPLLLPGLIGWLAARRRAEPEIARFADLVGLVELWYVLIISVSATKLSWYAIPTAPLSAILVALGLRAAWRRWVRDVPGEWFAPTDESQASRRAYVVLAIWAAASTAFIAYRIDQRERLQRVDVVHRMDHLLRDAPRRLPHDLHVAAIQPGVRSPHTDEPYAASTLFYVQALRMQGWFIDLVHAPSEVRPEHRAQIQCADTPAASAAPSTDEHGLQGCTIQRRAHGDGDPNGWIPAVGQSAPGSRS